jgi:N6-L-threonylcarbamoyladenine synthase
MILGIETSCDETAAALIGQGPVLVSNVVASQIDLHAKTGGVVPEVAARHHIEQINAVIATALSDAGLGFKDVSAVAVANRPGLLGALLVGVSAAKALSYMLEIPLIGIHHIEAHIYANWLVRNDLEFPLVALVASGGHTEIFLMTDHGSYEVLGRTRDDAAGEAFDKSARLLGLPYPGGMHIDRLAVNGDPKRLMLPRARLESESLDFSYSGLKTAVRTAKMDEKNAEIPIEDWAASIQEAIVAPLVDKTIKAAKRYGARNVLLAGGVAANSRLRSAMQDACDKAGFPMTSPPKDLCTDNAAIIGTAGYYHLQRGLIDTLELDTIASERLA